MYGSCQQLSPVWGTKAQMITDKLPPYSTDAEEGLIGSLLIDDQAILRVDGLLDGKDFFREQNQWAFEACKAVYERGEGINQITVANELEARDKLAMVGGATYLAYCVSVCPTSLHAEWYAGIVKRDSTLRQLIQAGGRIAQMGYDTGAEVDRALAQAQAELDKLREGGSSKGFAPLRELLDDCSEEMMRPTGERTEGARILTGYVDLDRILGGLHPSDLIIIAARPSVGKSAICLNIAEQTAMKGARVGVFSLEMSRLQVAQRFIASHAGVDVQALSLWNLNRLDEAKVIDSLGRLSEVAIYVDDTRGQRVSELRARAKQLSQRFGLDLLIVDYVGMVLGSGRGDNRVQEIGQITKGMKNLAGELKIPIIMAAQLNRAVEQRPDHRPMLSDLRESGDIEQDADVVAFIYREDKYVTSEQWQQKRMAQPYPAGVAEIIVAKHRNGPVGTCKLLFDAATTRFKTLESRREEGGHYWET